MENYNHSTNLDFDIDNSEIEPEEKIIKKRTTRKTKKENENESTEKITKKRTTRKTKKENENEPTEKITKKRTTKKTKKEENLEEDIEEHIEFKNTENIQQQILQTPSKYLKVENLNTQNISSQSTLIENEIDNIKTQIKELTIENNDLKLKLAKMETRLNNVINQFVKPSQNNDLQIDTELSYILNSE